MNSMILSGIYNYMVFYTHVVLFIDSMILYQVPTWYVFCWSFTEMPTQNFVESCFWNFDSLFQPQQHPARDAHDTFFISGQSYTI